MASGRATPGRSCSPCPPPTSVDLFRRILPFLLRLPPLLLLSFSSSTCHAGGLRTRGGGKGGGERDVSYDVRSSFLRRPSPSPDVWSEGGEHGPILPPLFLLPPHFLPPPDHGRPCCPIRGLRDRPGIHSLFRRFGARGGRSFGPIRRSWDLRAPFQPGARCRHQGKVQQKLDLRQPLLHRDRDVRPSPNRPNHSAYQGSRLF